MLETVQISDIVDGMCCGFDRKRITLQISVAAAGKIHPDDAKTYMLENDDIHFFIKGVAVPRKFIENQHLSIQAATIDASRKDLLRLGITDFKTGTFTGFEYRNYKWIEWRDINNIRLEYVEII